MPAMLDRHLPSDFTLQLAGLLNDIARNEILTHHLYRAYIDADQCMPTSLLPQFRQAVEEDQLHFDAITACLERLGVNRASLPSIRHQETQNDIEVTSADSLLKALYRSETFSIQAYSQICAMTIEQDYRTFDLSFQHLHENVTHLDMVKRLIGSSSTAISLV